MTPAQLIALSMVAGNKQDGIQINSAADYERWCRMFAEQNSEERILEAAREELRREIDASA